MKVRWPIFLFTCAFAMLAYLQRTSLGVAAQNIMPDLQLSQLQIGWLNAAFATCYALAQLPGGVLGQQYGARLTLSMVGLFGLIATLATPLAPVLLGGTALFIALLAAQGLLGLSQGPVFPMVAVVLQTWFPQRQWAVTTGLNSLGMNIGGAMTAPLIVVLTVHFGWQGALLWIALPAVLLTVAWAWYGRDTPQGHPRVTPVELAELDAGDLQKPPPMTLARLRRHRRRYRGPPLGPPGPAARFSLGLPPGTAGVVAAGRPAAAGRGRRRRAVHGRAGADGDVLHD